MLVNINMKCNKTKSQCVKAQDYKKLIKKNILLNLRSELKGKYRHFSKFYLKS